MRINAHELMRWVLNRITDVRDKFVIVAGSSVWEAERMADNLTTLMMKNTAGNLGFLERKLQKQTNGRRQDPFLCFC